MKPDFSGNNPFFKEPDKPVNYQPYGKLSQGHAASQNPVKKPVNLKVTKTTFENATPLSHYPYVPPVVPSEKEPIAKPNNEKTDLKAKEETQLVAPEEPSNVSLDPIYDGRLPHYHIEEEPDQPFWTPQKVTIAILAISVLVLIVLGTVLWNIVTGL